MGFLDKGSLLKHKNLGFLVRIVDIQRDNYVLGWVEKPEHPITEALLRGRWTASDLIREFRQQIKESRWDRLLDDSILGEDTIPKDEDEPQLEV